MEYGDRRGVPWGISESAYNTLDLALNYQYRAFGVPGLGLKSGLAEDLVVSPYSTVMALMVDPAAAVGNLRALATRGDGRALRLLRGDRLHRGSGPARSPLGHRALVHGPSPGHEPGGDGQRPARRADGAPLPRRSADPRHRAAAPGAGARPGRADSRRAWRRRRARRRSRPISARPTGSPSSTRRSPSTMLLSNGTYSVLLTASGAGTSTYRDLALTRWREDATLDRGGTFCYIRSLAEREDLRSRPPSRPASGRRRSSRRWSVRTSTTSSTARRPRATGGATGTSRR